MPKPKRSSAAKKKKAAAAAKRLRTRPPTPEPLETPFVSLLSKKDYFYDAKKEEPHTLLMCSPANPTAPLPANAGPFLRNAVSAFSKDVQDVLLGPDYLVVIFTLDADKIPLYYAFVKQGKLRIPNSDFAVFPKSAAMEDLLEAYIDDDQLQQYLIATGIRTLVDDDEPSDFDTTSDSSEEEITPPAPRGHGRMPLLAIRKPVLDISTTSALPTANETTEKSTLPEEPLGMDTSEQEAPPTTTPNQAEAQPTVAPTPTTEQDSDAMEPATVTQGTSSRSRPRSRFVPIDFAKLKVEVPPPPIVLTILFRPTTTGQSLKSCNPAKLCKELETYGRWTARRDIREGGLAVDFPIDTPSEPILAMSHLVGLPIKASLPVTATTTAGVLNGVHWELTEDELLQEIRTTPECKILAVKRLAKPGQRSWVIKMIFDGTIIPTHAMLYGKRQAVKPYLASPLICFNCSRYGHTGRVCKSEQRCVHCSQNHSSSECPNLDKPFCCHCKGNHPANSKDCPTWGFQRKINEVRATNQVTFKAARQAVGKAARSYAAAAKATSSTNEAQQTTGSSQARPAPPATRNFATNTAHPRPTPPPADAAALATLFAQLIQILTTAAASSNFTDAIQQVTSLFTALVPDLQP